MACTDISLDNLTGHPITYSEMENLLEPLQTYLQRLESSLQDLSNSLPKEAVKEMIVSVESEALSSKAFASDTQNDEFRYDVVQISCDEAIDKEAPVTSGLIDDSQGPSMETGGNEEELDCPTWMHDSDAVHHSHDNHTRLDLLETMKVKQELQVLNFGGNISVAENIIVSGVDAFLDRWESLEEPPRSGRLSQIISSNLFQTTCMSVITFNSALVAYNSDWQIQHIGATEPVALTILEMACLAFFIIELALRLGVHRCYFFVNADMYWNIFDFVLVSISVVDLIVDRIVGLGSNGNVGFMRLLRLLKLARIFRSLRSFRFFKSLAQLLESFQKSLVSLFWGCIMLAFVLYLFSLIFMQAMIDILVQNDLHPDKQQAIVSNFGSLSKTIVSLYMSVTGGNDWSIYYDISCYAGWAYGFAFMFYTFILYFALFNILTGSLVEKAMSASKPDRADRILMQRRVYAEQRQQFIDVCNAMDINGDGKISWDEFQQCMGHPAVLAYMASIGIEVHDVELFFETVTKSRLTADSARTGEVDIEMFVQGCMHMKGSATSIDMQRQIFEMHLLQQEFRSLQESFDHRFRHLEHMIGGDGKSIHTRQSPPVTTI